MSLIRSLFERVVDNLRARVRRVEMPTQLPRNPEELLKLAEGAVRQLLAPPSVGGTPAELEVTEQSPMDGGFAAGHAGHAGQTGRMDATSSAPAASTSSPAGPKAAAPAAPLTPPQADASPSEPGPRPTPSRRPEDALEHAPSMEIEASKFELGPVAVRRVSELDLDAHLPPLPEGYGDARLFLLPRSPHWVLAMWDFSAEQKGAARATGGAVLGLRIFDVTDRHAPGRLSVETRVDELARSYYLRVEPGRTYVAELGYWRHDGSFASLGASAECETPANAPRSGTATFVTIDYDRPEPAQPTVSFARSGMPVAPSLTRAVAAAIGRDLPGARAGHAAARTLGARGIADTGSGASEAGVPPTARPGATAVRIVTSSGEHVLWGGFSEPGSLPTSR